MLIFVQLVRQLYTIKMQENAQVVNFILYIQIYYSDGIIKSYPSSHTQLQCL